jgi:hypothetical protein
MNTTLLSKVCLIQLFVVEIHMSFVFLEIVA